MLLLSPRKSLDAPSPGTPQAPAEVVLCDGHRIQADVVIAAVPPRTLARLLKASEVDVPCDWLSGASLCEGLSGIAHKPVGVVNVSFGRDVFKGRFRGAGYFAGSLEDVPILSMSWDSMLFPGDSRESSQLTVYVGGEDYCGMGRETTTEDAAMLAVRQHLGVRDEPVEVITSLLPEAAPQYDVGHHRKLRAINDARMKHLPWLQVAGAGYFGTRSPADEIVDARVLTDALSRRFARFPGLVENETSEDVAHRYGGGFDAD